jgi:hypothetical protein
MLSILSQVNIISVLAATFATFVLGGIWFGAVVAKQYVVVMGRETLPPQKPSPLYVFGPILPNLAITITSAVLLKMLNLQSLPEALTFGMWVGVGYLISMCLMIAINPNFPHPFKYTLLNAPYLLASSLITSAILFLT